MRLRSWTVPFLCYLCCVSLAAAWGDNSTTAEGHSVTVTAAVTVDAGENINTYFRPQENMTTTDASTEEHIPGLEDTNYKKTWRSMPNLEHLSPFLTTMVPFLPTIKFVTNVLGMHWPHAWPLASTGPQGDYMMTAFAVYGRAFIGRGPKPLIHPTLLVAAPSAHVKLSEDLKNFAQLPHLGLLADPHKKALMAVAVQQQLIANSIVVAAPKLSEASNGTVMMTAGKTKLVLLVRPDGSRYLVSNTTTSKLLAMDVSCHNCGPFTYQIVDNFVVPKMSPTPPKPGPLFTQEEIAKWPEEIKMMQQGMSAMPKALSEMPGAMWGMVLRQLPEEHQQMFKKLAKMHSLVSFNATRQ